LPTRYKDYLVKKYWEAFYKAHWLFFLSIFIGLKTAVMFITAMGIFRIFSEYSNNDPVYVAGFIGTLYGTLFHFLGKK
jgi:hypothetical protein